jgi:hypothetical protein
LRNKPQGCGASVASAAVLFTTHTLHTYIHTRWHESHWPKRESFEVGLQDVKAMRGMLRFQRK